MLFLKVFQQERISNSSKDFKMEKKYFMKKCEF
jgi:hypothetical protein